MPKKITPKITCPKCLGVGQVDLSPELNATLSLVKASRKVTSHQAAELLKWTGSMAAMNKRLEELRALNLLERKRDGKFFYYSAL